MDQSRGNIGNGYYGDNRGGTGGGEAPAKNDSFEDYMWMANEEEAEREMLKQIEDEQAAQKCFNEMLDEEERIVQPEAASPWQSGQVGWSSGCAQQAQPGQPWGTHPAPVPPEEALANNIRTMSVNDKPKVELNPLAAEFVPGQTFQPASG
ncbi:polyadenylate-binding protein-interacting protein 2B-like [Pollicipes pollicipes]|uniref:polyadenylate-binding protein-interacting protein 2B-like n=1 Tax=Pollicipes pollicipes TaxID=41117 RepID=UPI001884B042|nr:polyadenylate-binding protein-interacting protein 2B-like [Pollicipes pollicipes]XP_037093333.1 polyadenylate-binding protein-interacting protein 2B-like [Pollicipes pollicipes]